MYYANQIKEHLDIPKICGTKERNLENQLRVLKYLRSLEVFSNLKAEFL